MVNDTVTLEEEKGEIAFVGVALRHRGSHEPIQFPDNASLGQQCFVHHLAGAISFSFVFDFQTRF